MKVGITGNIGAGKTTVSQVFKSLNIPVVNADDISREIVAYDHVKKTLKNLFGEEIYLKNGALDRKTLAEHVFNHPSQLKLLNDLLHPLIFSAFLKKCNQISAPYILFEAAVIYEADYQKQLDKVIVVHADQNIAIQRVMKRDALAEKEVLARLSNQISAQEKNRRADFIIQNNGTEMIIPQVLAIHQRLLKMTSKR